MQESDLFELFQLAMDSMWSHLQWWTGMSVGLLAVANFARERLNLIQVLGISVLYVAFSWYTQINVSMQLGLSSGFSVELARLQESGNLSPGGSEALISTIETTQMLPVPLTISILGLFLGALAYLWGVYLKERRRGA